jgi:hypothetical protein
LENAVSESRQPGYIAVSRAIFDHPLFRTTKRFSRLEAWEWLINAASWKPKGKRNKFGTIHTDRGQLCITRRELASAWHWPKTNVDRFLVKLAAEGMVLIGAALNGPKNRPQTDPTIGYPQTMITICNYDKFQHIRKSRADQQPGQKAGQNQPQIPGIIEEFEVEPQNQIIIESSLEVGERKVWRDKPMDGAEGRGMIWADYLGPLWKRHAEDYQRVTGSIPMPVLYIGGRGRWFKKRGQAAKLSKTA